LKKWLAAILSKLVKSTSRVITMPEPVIEVEVPGTHPVNKAIRTSPNAQGIRLFFILRILFPSFYN
jgi:hypothetical protein